ncbi:hypothetical protein [Streptomyces sp. NPDC048248]|uniref:hypothetical protein n=1 Tax=Streptomyces sp. NPDC048248 TaxID=3365523 RepID=UPI0037221CDA
MGSQDTHRDRGPMADPFGPKIAKIIGAAINRLTPEELAERIRRVREGEAPPGTVERLSGDGIRTFIWAGEPLATAPTEHPDSATTGGNDNMPDYSMDEIPDYPPLAEPGDLVAAAFKRHALTGRDWTKFVDGTQRWTTEWKTMIGHLERRGGEIRISPKWLGSPTDQIQHEANRLEGLGEPEWRLWNAWAEERRQQG